jgi:energy-coupling factor transporter ATP-binding protein EcfA2
MTVESTVVRSPYPGLRPFQSYEAPIFFGRETHVDRLLKILVRERFLAVIGPSGCGKSSLVRAGMLPAVRAGWAGTPTEWRVAIMRPGDHPMRSLARALIDPVILGTELGFVDGSDAALQFVPLIESELARGPSGYSPSLRRRGRTKVKGSRSSFCFS